MGEMMGVSVTAGGSVDRQTWREFIRAMNDSGFSFGIGPCGQIFLADEANYGNTDEVQDACKTHHIAYRASSDAKYEYSGCVDAWFPGMNHVVGAMADQNGDASIQIFRLARAAEEGKTLADLIAEHEPFLRPIPPMLIDGLPVTDADLEDAADDEDEREVA